MRMKKSLTFLTVSILFAALSFVFCVPGQASNRPPLTRQQHKGHLTYNKNYYPPGWQYEVGYAMWRLNRNMPLSYSTYRRYKSDRAWQAQLRAGFRAQKIVLDAADWTVEEIALFIHNNRELFRFHPAGLED